MGGNRSETTSCHVGVRGEHPRDGRRRGRCVGGVGTEHHDRRWILDRRRPDHQRQRRGGEAGQERPADRNQGERPDARRHLLDDQGRLLSAGTVVGERGRRLQGPLQPRQHEEGAAGRPQDRLPSLPGRRRQPAEQPADRAEARAAGPGLRGRRDLRNRSDPEHGLHEQEPGAVRRLGLPARILRHALGLRVRRLPRHRLLGSEAPGVPGEPRVGPDRGREPDGQDDEGRAAGPGQRLRPPREQDDQRAVRPRGCEGRVQRGEHPGPELGRELHAVRPGREGVRCEPAPDPDQLPDGSRPDGGDDGGRVHRHQRELRGLHPRSARRRRSSSRRPSTAPS